VRLSSSALPLSLCLLAALSVPVVAMKLTSRDWRLLRLVVIAFFAHYRVSFGFQFGGRFEHKLDQLRVSLRRQRSPFSGTPESGCPPAQVVTH
jgi:hypothetical protein